MSSMFLAITSVSAGVAAWLAGASAALSSAAAATQPMPILVMICLPPISLLAPRPAAARDAQNRAARPVAPAGARAWRRSSPGTGRTRNRKPHEGAGRRLGSGSRSGRRRSAAGSRRGTVQSAQGIVPDRSDTRPAIWAAKRPLDYLNRWPPGANRSDQGTDTRHGKKKVTISNASWAGQPASDRRRRQFGEGPWSPGRVVPSPRPAASPAPARPSRPRRPRSRPARSKAGSISHFRRRPDLWVAATGRRIVRCACPRFGRLPAATGAWRSCAPARLPLRNPVSPTFIRNRRPRVVPAPG